MWNYTVTVDAGDDIGAAILAAHDAHLEASEGASLEAATSATKDVQLLANAAANVAAAVGAKGELLVDVSAEHAEAKHDLAGTKLIARIEVRAVG